MSEYLYNVDADPIYGGIPDRIVRALLLWGKEGRRPGGFLTAVLCHDLRSICLADPEVLPHLKAVFLFVLNQMPSGCHGSREKMERWEDMHATKTKVDRMREARSCD